MKWWRLFARTIHATALLTLAVGASAAAPDPRPLELVPIGAPRELPEKILGASAEPLYDHLIDDPRKIAQVKLTAPAVLRFPGGTLANYYNWRTGLLAVDAGPNSSGYMTFWTVLAPKLARLYPNGISLQEYTPFVRALGADVILVPNLETSTVAEQAAWFRTLASAGVLPNIIELGNEFYLAMVNDPQVLRRWPDEPSTMVVMRQYETALRPIVGPGAKFAVQSAGSAFWVTPADRRPFFQRQLRWDVDLKPGGWFEAVTVHLYPEPAPIMARPGGNTPAGLFGRMMGRASEGVDRVLDDIARRLPGKEIWITEWNPRGGTPTVPGRAETVTPAMMAHLAAQMSFAYLRHKEVTRALYFMLFFRDDNAFQSYVGDRAGRFEPLPATVVLGWFNRAANGGATFQRLTERGAGPTSYAEAEHYRAIEAGLFRSGSRTTLILENSSAEARRYDPTAAGYTASPNAVEIIAAPDLASAALRPAQIQTAPADRPIVLPPYSVARIVWE